MKNIYIMCLDNNYEVKFENNNKDITIMELESMLDNAIYLLQSYGVDEEEIKNGLLDGIDAIVEKMK